MWELGNDPLPGNKGLKFRVDIKKLEKSTPIFYLWPGHFQGCYAKIDKIFEIYWKIVRPNGTIAFLLWRHLQNVKLTWPMAKCYPKTILLRAVNPGKIDIAKILKEWKPFPPLLQLLQQLSANFWHEMILKGHS